MVEGEEEVVVLWKKKKSCYILLNNKQEANIWDNTAHAEISAPQV